MITREEYNKALDIVEAYHKQLFIGGVVSSKPKSTTSMHKPTTDVLCVTETVWYLTDFICKQVVIGQQAALHPKRAVPAVGLGLSGANVC